MDFNIQYLLLVVNQTLVSAILCCDNEYGYRPLFAQPKIDKFRYENIPNFGHRAM